MLFAVGNDRCQRSFTSGPRCGGNCNEQRQFFMHFQKAFHLPDALARFYNSGSCSLGAIHRRTAAKCNQCLSPFLQIQVFCLFYIPDRRICYRPVIDTVSNSFFFQGFLQKRSKSQLSDTCIRHNHHFLKFMLSQYRRNLRIRRDNFRIPIR